MCYIFIFLHRYFSWLFPEIILISDNFRSQVGERIRVILDCDDNTLSFEKNYEFLGVAFRGMIFHLLFYIYFFHILLLIIIIIIISVQNFRQLYHFFLLLFSILFFEILKQKYKLLQVTLINRVTR